MKKGKLIVIEGTDGSGKQTQTQLLSTRLLLEGFDNLKISFPCYDSPSSALVKMYLAGEFGTNPNDVSAYAAASFYALDRYAAYKTKFGKFYENGGLVLADRYTTSNLIHQAEKFDDDVGRYGFEVWLKGYEYHVLKLPEPDMVIFLNMPVEFSKKLIENRDNKITNQKQKDIHERDEKHLEKAYEIACIYAKKYHWKEVKCVEDGVLKTPDKIHEEIYQMVKEIV